MSEVIRCESEPRKLPDEDPVLQPKLLSTFKCKKAVLNTLEDSLFMQKYFLSAVAQGKSRVSLVFHSL
jgi:hypothetical protein